MIHDNIKDFCHKVNIAIVGYIYISVLFHVVEVEQTAYNGYNAKTWDHEILRTVYKKTD